MCPKKGVVRELLANEGRSVDAEKTKCEMFGVRTVRLMTSNGLMILKSVYPVPYLRRYVISFGATVERGSSFDTSGGLLQVRRDYRMMLLGKHVENLCVVRGMDAWKGFSYSRK